jgi:hypothetical protein
MGSEPYHYQKQGHGELSAQSLSECAVTYVVEKVRHSQKRRTTPSHLGGVSTHCLLLPSMRGKPPGKSSSFRSRPGVFFLPSTMRRFSKKMYLKATGVSDLEGRVPVNTERANAVGKCGCGEIWR